MSAELAMQCNMEVAIRRHEGAPVSISCCEQQRCTRISLPSATISADASRDVCEGCNVRMVAFRCGPTLKLQDRCKVTGQSPVRCSCRWAPGDAAKELCFRGSISMWPKMRAISAHVWCHAASEEQYAQQLQQFAAHFAATFSPDFSSAIQPGL